VEPAKRRARAASACAGSPAETTTCTPRKNTPRRALLPLPMGAPPAFQLDGRRREGARLRARAGATARPPCFSARPREPRPRRRARRRGFFLEADELDDARGCFGGGRTLTSPESSHRPARSALPARLSAPLATPARGSCGRTHRSRSRSMPQEPDRTNRPDSISAQFSPPCVAEARAVPDQRRSSGSGRTDDSPAVAPRARPPPSAASSGGRPVGIARGAGATAPRAAALPRRAAAPRGRADPSGDGAREASRPESI